VWHTPWYCGVMHVGSWGNFMVLVRARDFRTLWSRVLQHHHHHLRQAFASRFGFLSNANERKPETELLVWKHERVATENQKQNFLFENTRESQQKKRDPNLINSNQDLSSLLFFSPLSSSSSSLAYSSAALLLQATLPPCWESENGRARTSRAGN
jgi:hypothetical protein